MQVCNNVFCTTVIITLFVLISINCIDMKQVYPRFMIDTFYEPYVRFLAYILIYLIAHYNFTIALLCMVALLSFHIDFTNLSRYILA